ncbi:unnamed protein product [Cunninghamella blakesleeana]
MMFIKALGLSIFTLATLITAQGYDYNAVIQWGSNSQYIIPGNDTIGNQLQLDTKKAEYSIATDGSGFGKSYNIKVDGNEAEKQCWQVNNSTMLVEIAPCLSGNEKQLFSVI